MESATWKASRDALFGTCDLLLKTLETVLAFGSDIATQAAL